MTVKQVVTFTINKDLEKFKVQAAEVVSATKVGIFLSLFYVAFREAFKVL